MLTGILRKEWSFSGLIITDWDDWEEHYRGVLAGNNVCMPHGSPKRLQKAMELGLISREQLVTNARYVLEWLLKLD